MHRFIKSQLGMQTLASCLLIGSTAHAAPAVDTLPAGGQLLAGQATISQTNNTLNINQTSDKAAINWSSFNVGKDATVNFNQPSASSVTLNRVQSGNPSQIFGQIHAKGQVFLTNSSGVYFAPGASVEVGALVASTHSISNEDFMAGRNIFSRNGATGAVVNDGTITANLAGYVALLAPEVRNNGLITAQFGSVVLAAGEVVELQFDGNNLLNNIRVEPSAVQALVENGNAIHASNGLIILSAQAVNSLQGGGIINNQGSLEATGFVSHGGVIRLEASDKISHTGSINVDAAADSSANGGTAMVIASLSHADSLTEINGSISARGGAHGGDGGFVETSANRVEIGNATRVDTRAVQGKTGTWLIDPTDFTIAASGGNETGVSVSASLALSDRSILVADNIHVNDSVSWSANKLTLTATNGDININAVMTASGTSSLDLEPGSGKGVNVGFDSSGAFKGRVDFGGRSGTYVTGSVPILTISNQNYTIINALGIEGDATTGTNQTLQGMARAGNLAGNFALGSNIDATATALWNSSAGFSPIGVNAAQFSGYFNGLGHTISGLTINLPSTEGVGLFGSVNLQTGSVHSVISNVGLLNVAITGQHRVGALIGNRVLGYTHHNYATGMVTGSGNYIGGLIGFSNEMSVAYSYSAAIVYGANYVGGLIGASNGGSSWVGYSYATGKVTASGDYAGGLVGEHGFASRISESYATGEVSGANKVGGLAGLSLEASSIRNSYATGKVSGTTNQITNQIGGLVGEIVDHPEAAIINSYATGLVTGTTDVGGLIGKFNNGILTANFWDVTSSGKADGLGIGNILGVVGVAGTPQTGVTGLTTANMKLQGSFTPAGTATDQWNFTTPVWRVLGAVNAGYPCLAWSATCIPTPAYLRLTTGTSIYGDTPSLGYALYDASSGGNVISDAIPSGSVTWSTPLSATSNANTYAEHYVSGISLGNSAYAVSVGSDVNWLISPRPLTITAGNALRNYGSANPTVTAFTVLTGSLGSGSGLVNGDLINSVSNTFASTATATANAATTHAITSSAPVFGSGTVGNYAITYADGTLTIEKAHLTVTADAQSRLYGANNPTFTETITGFVNGETASVVTGTGIGSSAAVNTTGVGTAVITASNSGLSAANYDFSNLVNGTLTIAKAPLTVTADAQSRLYGANNPTFTESITGFVNGETFAVVTGVGVGSSTAVSSTGVGTAVITASNSGLSAANYDFSNLVNGSLTIAKAPLTVTADAQLRLYGANNPTFTETITGFVNGETASVVTGLGVGSSAAVNTTGVGTAVITASNSGLSAANYDFSNLVNGTLTINKAHLTVTADAQLRLYGANNPTFTESITGFVNGETVAVVTGMGVGVGVGVGSSIASSSTGVGTAVITASNSGLSAANYDFSNLVNGTLTIAKAPLTVTADAQSRLYGAANPTFTETITGFLNGETASVVTGVGVGSSAAVSSTGVGTAVITASNSGLSAANYDFTTLVNGTLTIAKAPLTVTADAQSRLYGAANPTFTETITGFLNGETLAVVTGTGIGSSAAVNTTGVGTAVITASNSGLSAANYDFSNLVNGTLTIAKSPLTVTADAQSRLYGAANPTFTESITGFVNGETLAVVTGVGVGSSIAANTTGVGTAVITASNSGLSAANYDFSNLVNGTLTIDKAPATITGNSATGTYSGVSQTVSGFTASGLVNGETAAVLSGVSASTTGTNVGSYNVVPTGVDSNYALSFVNGTLTIAKAPPTIPVNSATGTSTGSSSGVSPSGSGLVSGELASAPAASKTAETSASPASTAVAAAEKLSSAELKTEATRDVAASDKLSEEAKQTEADAQRTEVKSKQLESDVAKAELALKVAEANAGGNTASPALVAQRLDVAAKKSEAEGVRIEASAKKVEAEGKHAESDAKLADAEAKLAVVEAREAKTPEQKKSAESKAQQKSIESVIKTAVAQVKKERAELKKEEANAMQADADASSTSSRATALESDSETTEAAEVKTEAQQKRQLAKQKAAEVKQKAGEAEKKSKDAFRKVAASVGATTLAMNRAMRSELKTEIFSSAVNVLDENPKIADLPVCSVGLSDVCIPKLTISLSSESALTPKAGVLAVPSVTIQSQAMALAGRGLPVPTVTFLPQVERKVALLVGINNYKDPAIPTLESAVEDVEAIGKLMAEQLGYEVRVIKDATRADIVKSMNALAQDVGVNDSVAVYFAGHGYAIEKNKVKTGYWLPADASAKDPSQWVSNNDIGQLLSNIPAKQTMLISDSCYSGNLVGTEKVTAQATVNPTEILSNRTVTVMSSGGDEPVSDEGKDGHSIFAWSLMDSMKKVGEVSAVASLFDTVRSSVIQDYPQVPQYGSYTSAGHTQGGDYLVEVRKF